ncbi:MAG: hypothetical protein KME60_03145 [Cyanomargarita calcarea GSE-NOS-MK-12-04C]|jgi:hypothetical protein|uniref:Uncharacterized protein n=1 Tax=Cyanomargarita calcarea GSE-NOS-MK-12-04C TaxID=2839659 RepID=A0A951QJE9_9CYAN|nr:hypothetical protein [Cyanomargarita calcarea GSE-NOS-MK-12-04C]
MAAIFHLTNTDNGPNRYAIEQGATFNWLTLVLDGDFTTWQPRGQIRDRYVENGGTIKASFTFPTLVQGSAALPNGGTATGTILRPQLSDEQTTSLDWLATKMAKRSNNKEQAIIGRNVWVYDIEIESPAGEVMRVVEGYVEVSPEATR